MLIPEKSARKYFRENHGIELPDDFCGVDYLWSDQEVEMFEKYLRSKYKLTNKEAGLVEPDLVTLDNIEFIKKMGTLAEKIEQIGYETQVSLTGAFTGSVSKKSEKELDQIFGNIFHYMNFLRTLVSECPDTKDA
jgi:hypothetical protein